MEFGDGSRTAICVPSYDDILSRIARFETFQVADRIYSADLLIPELTIRARDMLTEAATNAALISYWGMEAARARRHVARVEASYRSWRDRMWLDLKSTPVEQGEKLKIPSDATAEKMYRTHPEYGVWQHRIADAQESAECAEAVHEAFKAKKDLLRIMENVLRDESAGPYFIVEQEPGLPMRQPQLEGDPIDE